MRSTFFLAALLFCFFNVAHSEDKKGHINVDGEKKEGTINIDKSGTWKGGLSAPPQKPDASKTEEDKRREQQNSGGQLIIKKTFP